MQARDLLQDAARESFEAESFIPGEKTPHPMFFFVILTPSPPLGEKLY